MEKHWNLSHNMADLYPRSDVVVIGTYFYRHFLNNIKMRFFIYLFILSVHMFVIVCLYQKQVLSFVINNSNGMHKNKSTIQNDYKYTLNQFINQYQMYQ